MTRQIDEAVQKKFAATCEKQERKQNEVLEALMNLYAIGEINLEMEYRIKKE